MAATGDNSYSLITTGKADNAASGYIWAAKKTASLVIPTDATTALPESFACLGAITSDGITQSKSRETTDYQDMTGDDVYTAQSRSSEQFALTLMTLNVAGLKQYYGDANVTEDTKAGTLHIAHNGDEAEEYVYVWETITSDGRIDRTVVPRGKVIELGDVVKAPGELLTHQITIKALKDDTGHTAHDYFGRAA